MDHRTDAGVGQDLNTIDIGKVTGDRNRAFSAAGVSRNQAAGRIVDAIGERISSIKIAARRIHDKRQRSRNHAVVIDNQRFASIECGTGTADDTGTGRGV